VEFLEQGLRRKSDDQVSEDSLVALDDLALPVLQRKLLLQGGIDGRPLDLQLVGLARPLGGLEGSLELRDLRRVPREGLLRLKERAARLQDDAPQRLERLFGHSDSSASR